MSKKDFNEEIYVLRMGDDMHLALGPRPLNAEAWQRSVETIACEDRLWLQQHPEAEYRERSITLVEMVMNGHPHGTTVRTMRGPGGSQIRMFLLPAEDDSHEGGGQHVGE